MTTTLSLDEVEQLSDKMLRASGAAPHQAIPTAASIREAEADGIRSGGRSTRTDSRRPIPTSVSPARWRRQAGTRVLPLALLVDLLAGGLTGSSFSFEASGFAGNDGGPPDVGQVVLAIDPTVTASTFLQRVETELTAMTAEAGVRLPGGRRLAHRAAAERDGVEVPDELMATLRSFAEHGSPSRRRD